MPITQTQELLDRMDAALADLAKPSVKQEPKYRARDVFPLPDMDPVFTVRHSGAPWAELTPLDEDHTAVELRPLSRATYGMRQLLEEKGESFVLAKDLDQAIAWLKEQRLRAEPSWYWADEVRYQEEMGRDLDREVPCPRCDGEGFLPQHSHRDKGRCYACNSPYDEPEDITPGKQSVAKILCFELNRHGRLRRASRWITVDAWLQDSEWWRSMDKAQEEA